MSKSMIPYLAKGIIAWIEDNGQSPFVLVDTTFPGIDVPPSMAHAHQAVFNLALSAVTERTMDEGVLRFHGTFPEGSTVVSIPLEAVLAVFSSETGKGLVLPRDPQAPPPTPEERRSHFHIVQPDDR